MILSYIGSKKTLLPFISKVIDPLLKELYDARGPVVFNDCFMGSGCVSNHFKKNVHVGRVIASDTELYSFVLGKALLTCPYSHKLAIVIDQLNLIKTSVCKTQKRNNLIHNTFASNGRLYFSPENALRIDIVRQALDRLYHANAITYSEFLFLLGSLIVSASSVANTCGTFRAHLKALSCKAKKKFKIFPIHADADADAHADADADACILGNIVKQKDAIQNSQCSGKYSGSKPVLVYLDPPYNSCHYGAYYSFLNYLCMYDGRLKTVGTGTLEQYKKSRFGLVKYALKEFEILFDSITADFIVMSYSSCGIVNISDLVNLLCKKGSVVINKIWYKAYKANHLNKQSHVVEYIIVCDCRMGSGQSGGLGGLGQVKKCWLKL